MAAEELELGPIDIIVIGFPPGAPMTGESVPILLDLVDRGIVRVFDARIVRKNEDGTFSHFDPAEVDVDRAGDFVAFKGASTGLIGDEDIEEVANNLEPGSVAVMIVYENRWAEQFATSIRRNGGYLIASDRITVQDLLDALEAAEAAS